MNKIFWKYEQVYGCFHYPLNGILSVQANLSMSLLESLPRRLFLNTQSHGEWNQIG